MPNELKRHLSWLDAVSVVVGIVIGAGIFVTPQELARLLPSTNAMMLAWLVSGTLVFCGALAFAELSTMMPSTGGLYIYLREAFGPALAFSSGWVHLFALFSGATAFVASGFTRYLNALVPVDASMQVPITIALIVSIAALGAVSTPLAVLLQNVTNFAKIAALLSLIGLSFFAPAAAVAAPVDIPVASFGAALASCFFCYEGWSYAGFVAGEMKNPKRDLPRAFAISFVVVVALYLMVNLAYVRVLTIGELQASGQVGADVAGRVVGPIGSKLLAIVIVLAIVGTVNGLTLTASRMYYAQSLDGLFLPGLDKIHPKFGTPLAAIAAHTIVSCLLVLFSSSLGFVLTLAISAAWLYYAIAVVGLMRLRASQPDRERPYKMWGYPVTPLLFLLGTAGFLASLTYQSPKPALCVLLIMAASFPIHSFVGRSKSA
jgi:APA family basic amino acid/polyamine antiporter